MTTMNFFQYGYMSTEKSSGPLQIGKLIGGVKNCLAGVVNVQKGEKVLLLCDYEVDQLVVQAFVAVGTMLGSEVSVLYDRSFSMGGTNPQIPTPAMRAASEASDVVISLCWFPDVHSPGMLTPKSKTRWVSMYGQSNIGALSGPGAQFPPEIAYKLMEKTTNTVQQAIGKKCHVTSGNGTDITATITKLSLGAWTGPYLKPGKRCSFPMATYGFEPADGNGVICYELTYQLGQPEAPMYLHFKDNKCTKIEGGGPGEAERVTTYLGLDKKNTSAGEFVEIMWGLNPKARLKGDATQLEKERHASTIHFGVATAQYRGVECLSHCDFFVETPTIYIDNQVIVKDRHLLLLEDKEIRTIAAKYGDPDKLLAPDIYL